MNALLLQSTRKTTQVLDKGTIAQRKRRAYTEGAKLSIEPLGGQLLTTGSTGESAPDPYEYPTFWC
jgi:hypothetical protein